MKVLDVITSTVPNVFKNKSPEKVVYKKKKNNYGGMQTASKDGHCATDGAHSSNGGSTGGTSGGAAGSGAAGAGSGAGAAGGGGAGGGAGGGH